MLAVVVVFIIKSVWILGWVISRRGVDTGGRVITCFSVKPEVFLVSDRSVCGIMKLGDGCLCAGNGGTEE